MTMGRQQSIWWGWVLIPAVLIVLSGGHSAAAQEDLPPGVPEDADPRAGQSLFQQRCANCHGPTGMGDGPLAAQLPNPPVAIGTEAFLSTTDPAAIFAQIQNGNVPAGMPGFGMGNNSNPLTEAEIWDVVAAVYNLQRPIEPLAEAMVDGVVEYGSDGPLPTGLTATLQAFDTTFNEALRLDTDVAANGAYQFDLKLVPPDWVYRVIVSYNDLDFSSGISTIDPADPLITLPVKIYETTADDSALRVSQLQLLVEFFPGTVQVAEIYNFSHETNTVYVGETGNIDGGTIELNIPEGATNVTLLRGFGSATDFVPLNQEELLPEGASLRPKIPVGPGNGTLRLLLRYELLFESGLTLERPLAYPVDLVEAVLPDSGVTIGAEGGWQSGVPLPDTTGGASPRISYSHPPLSKGETLVVPFDGAPTAVFSPQGHRIITRNEGQETIIGGVALLVAVVMAGVVAFRWSSGPAVESERDELLGELAALEEAHEAGRVRLSSYRRRRAQLIDELTRIWE